MLLFKKKENLSETRYRKTLPRKKWQSKSIWAEIIGSECKVELSTMH
jgi:hypothetical protein